MQPDIQSLTARGLKLMDKLGMLDAAERALVRPYVACLELYLDEVRPTPNPKTPPSNIVSFEDVATARKVQRAETERRQSAAHRRGVGIDGWEVYDDE